MQVEELRGAKQVWNQFARENGGGILQSYEWGQFRAELDWKIQYLVVRDGSQIQALALVMRKRLPAGYTFYYCPEGPVVRGANWHDPGNQEAIATVTEYLHQSARRDRAMFLKIDPHLPVSGFPVDWLCSLGYKDSPEDIQAAVVTHVDLTPSGEDIFANMKQKGRYNIRKAVKNEVTVRKSQGAAALNVFYELHAETASRQGITHREKWYFELMRKHLMQSSDQAEFFVAEQKGAPIAAILVTYFGDEAIYLYGGSTQADRNIYASYLVQWAGMEEAKKRGAKFYNMTGIAATDNPDDPWAGLRQFKLKFGGPEIQLLGAYDRIFKPVEYLAFTNAERIRRKLAKRSGH